MRNISRIYPYELYTRAEWMPEYIRFMGWWYQDLNQEKEGDGASEGAEREVG